MGMSRPSIRVQKCSCFPFCWGEFDSVRYCTIPSRSTPSMVSAAFIGEPLSLSSARGGPSLLDPLRETVDQVRGVLALQVPLRVAAHPRAVIEQTEEIRCLPLPRRREHLPLALMEVEVPERIDVRVLVRAGLAGYHLRLTPLTLAAPPLALAQESMVLHEAAHRPIARHRTQRRILLHQDSEVVVMELIAPARVRLVLALQRRRERGRDARMRARVLGHLALERAQGVLLSARRVVHALDRLAGEAERLARGRMLPRRP